MELGRRLEQQQQRLVQLEQRLELQGPEHRLGLERRLGQQEPERRLEQHKQGQHKLEQQRQPEQRLHRRGPGRMESMRWMARQPTGQWRRRARRRRY